MPSQPNAKGFLRTPSCDDQRQMSLSSPEGQRKVQFIHSSISVSKHYQNTLLYPFMVVLRLNKECQPRQTPRNAQWVSKQPSPTTQYSRRNQESPLHCAPFVFVSSSPAYANLLNRRILAP